jgi:large subunit ribosomal protein L10
MLTRAAKDQQIKEFNAAFKTSPSVMVIEYIGLSVIEMEKLRKDVRGAQAELRVVKNTLLRLAAKDTDIEQIDELFDGPTAVAICESDPSAVAKVFVDAIKDAPMLKVRGGFVDGSVLDANAISELSKLPSRPELIAQFMGLIITPMSNFVGALSQMQVKLLYALEALKATKEEEPEKAASEVTEDASNDAKESVEETQEAVEETKEASEEAPSQSEEASEAEAKSEEPAQEPEQAEEKTQEAAQESQVAAEAEEAEAQEPEQAEEASEESEEEK